MQSLKFESAQTFCPANEDPSLGQKFAFLPEEQQNTLARSMSKHEAGNISRDSRRSMGKLLKQI